MPTAWTASALLNLDRRTSPLTLSAARKCAESARSRRVSGTRLNLSHELNRGSVERSVHSARRVSDPTEDPSGSVRTPAGWPRHRGVEMHAEPNFGGACHMSIPERPLGRLGVVAQSDGGGLTLCLFSQIGGRKLKPRARSGPYTIEAGFGGRHDQIVPRGQQPLEARVRGRQG